jgi:subtilisin family serine protease
VNQKIQEFEARLNRNLSKAQCSGPNSTNETSSNETDSTRRVEVIIRETRADDERGTDPHDTPIMTASNHGQGINSHRWLDSAVRFAKEMRPFWDSTLGEFMRLRQQQGTPEHIEDDVVVALIDDGIDIFDTTHPDQIFGGKSFDFHDAKVRPPYSSAGGHGTLVANMILRVRPMAKIYPIRLRTYKTPSGKNPIDRDYAAQVSPLPYPDVSSI